MPRPANTAAARQLEQIIRRFGMLSTLPAVVARFLSQPSASPTAAETIGELLESDPALSARIFALAHQHGMPFDGTAASIAELMRRLSPAVIRDAVLSTKVFQTLDVDYLRTSSTLVSRKKLAHHSLAVACCSKELARFCLPEADWPMAFSAGLLHDIGKLAIEDVMPKSFEKIVAAAQRQNASSCDIEQLYLGLDHAAIGRRLAQKLHVPDEIATAIWLHHSAPEIAAENMPAGRVAPFVRLADAMVRQAGIGDSGSYDPCDEVIAEMSAYLDLQTEQIDSVRAVLPSEVARRAQLLGLEDPDPAAAYCDAVQSTAVQLSGDVTRLTSENKRLSTGATVFDFTDEFFEALNSGASPVDISADFARRWQEFFQTGPVCVCLPDDFQPGSCTLVTFTANGRADAAIGNYPQEQPFIPPRIQSSFSVITGSELPWLMSQMPAQMDPARVRVAPLMAGNKAVALLAFEQRYVPASSDYLKTFEEISSIAGGVIAMAMAQQRHQVMAERFVLLAGRLRQAQKSLTDANALLGLAEMASGAAHELNTPLAVISGRAQLLLDSEQDSARKQMLQQIIDRADEVSHIVKELLEFAEPSVPRPAAADVRSMVDEALLQAAVKLNVEALEAQVNIDERIPQVQVDTSQVTPAIANILVNAQQAYTSGTGPVTVTASFDDQAGCVSIDIADSGAGMSQEVLAKATQPFFSAKPAGRLRGMGLAHAKRLIQLNGGYLGITSQQVVGTTVSVTLPVAQVP